MTAKLFTPITLGPVTYENRLAIAPMAQYSARDGVPNDWHLVHWCQLGNSGAGLVTIEATAVSVEGLNTPGDVGLYTDEQEQAFKRLLAAARGLSRARFGIQLGHAGRKASHQIFWEGGKCIAPAHGGWETVAPSALPFADATVPRAATEADIAKIRDDFANAARRAARVGVELIELHAAHGYLLHQFLSPVTNKRTDQYGGTLENRMRVPLAVFEAVRDAAPGLTLGVRLTGSDWIEGGITPDEAVIFAKELESRGCHYVDVTSGGIDPAQKIAVGPGYQLGFAETVKKNVGMAVRAVGLIVTPQQAEDALAKGQADIVAIGRGVLAQPRWGWEAAHALGAKIDIKPQYGRAAVGVWPGWTMRAAPQAQPA